MKWFVLLLLFLLISCAEAPVPIPVEPEPIVKELPPVVIEKLVAEPATRTVKQSGGLGSFVYGLTEDNRVVRVDKTGAVWEYKYENGRLVEIDGSENFEFLFIGDELSSIDLGSSKLLFSYDSRGRLVEVKGGRESLYFDYDTLDRLVRVRRGVAGATSFDYSDTKLSSLIRGSSVTKIIFDDRERVRSFDAQDTEFIFGYWRDDKLVSLTGKTFGSGLTVSYGPDYPAFEAKFVNIEDNSIFTSAYTDTLYRVVDEYIYCKYVRRLKDLLFDGISYAFFVNYFKGDIVDYLVMNFRCVPYEA